MAPEYWILNDCHEAVRADLLTWAKWFETADRIVKQEDAGPYFVSTVFLGLDHGLTGRFDADRPPSLFETMAFHGSAVVCMERCSTWNQAVRQHSEIVARLRAAATG